MPILIKLVNIGLLQELGTFIIILAQTNKYLQYFFKQIQNNIRQTPNMKNFLKVILSENVENILDTISTVSLIDKYEIICAFDTVIVNNKLST